MTDEQGFLGGVGGVLLIVIIVLVLTHTGAPTVTVYSALCGDPIVNGTCDVPTGPSTRETFTIYGDTQQVVASYDTPGSAPIRYNNCIVQNINNWSCVTDEAGNTVGFSQGIFVQDDFSTTLNNAFGIYYISWLRWWLMKFGLTALGHNSGVRTPQTNSLTQPGRVATQPLALFIFQA